LAGGIVCSVAVDGDSRDRDDHRREFWYRPRVRHPVCQQGLDGNRNSSPRRAAEVAHRPGLAINVKGPLLVSETFYLHGYAGMLKTSFTVENMIKTIDKVTIADTGRFLRYDGVRSRGEAR
jgi:hypothetical protein